MSASGGRRGSRARWRSRRCGRCSTASPASTTVMNSVMTAGLHHRGAAARPTWRGVGAGRPRARRRDCGTGDLAIELAAPRRRRAARSSARDFSEEMLERAREKAPRAVRVRVGQRAGAALRRRRASTPRRSASARATSPTSTAGWPRWRAWCGPAAGSSCSRSRRRSKPPLSTFFGVWFDRVVPLIGTPRRRAGRLHLPAELGQALPRRRRGWPRRWSAPGCSDIRWILTAGGIIATPRRGPKPLTHWP